MEEPVFTRDQIETCGERLLEDSPNAVVKYRILRDVLRRPTGDPELGNARSRMLTHPLVQELAGIQHADGSWGRFHSMDSTMKARFPTTEIAVRRALALGLDKDSGVLKRAVKYMHSVLEGEIAWSDRVEKAEGWSIAVEAITAATLAEVDPGNPAITQAWEYWADVALDSFHGGGYDPTAEWKSHKERRGLGIHYLNSRYALTLLGTRRRHLPEPLDRQLVEWIWKNKGGIGYLGANTRQPEPFHIFNWIESLEILSRFKSWRKVGRETLAWLWEQRNEDGRWDFGMKVSKSFYFPLSDDWRKAGRRAMDHTTRVLTLLSNYDPGL